MLKKHTHNIVSFKTLYIECWSVRVSHNRSINVFCLAALNRLDNNIVIKFFNSLDSLKIFLTKLVKQNDTD